MKYGLICVVASLLLSGCLASRSQDTAATVPPGNYQLVFTDDFKNIDLSLDGRGSHRWYEGVWFAHHHAPLANIQSTSEGLRLTWVRGQDQPDTSISTYSTKGTRTAAWRYGYYEVRMKWKPEPGAWPAIWLIPATTHRSETGELDIFEGNGDNSDTFYGTIHHWMDDPNNPTRAVDVQNTGKANRFRLPHGTNFSDYHTYGMLWEPDRVSWYLDGKLLHSEAAYPVFGKDDYCLIIGLQAGSDWKEGNLNRVSAQRMDMDVQWVRVWQKK